MEHSQTATVVSTYHRTMEGDGFNTICNFRDQQFDNFYLLFDNKLEKTEQEVSQAYGNVNVCLYNDNDFREHNFDKPISKFHRWGSHQNPNYFYAHHRMLLFWKKNPQFKYYWFFDDDVTFTGDLKGVLSVYENETEDFIAIQVFKKEDYENQFPKISKVNEKMGSGGNWLSFAPGPGDRYKNLEKHMGSFFPIVRFSNKAMEYLYNLNQENYFGYSEGFVPTTLASTPGFTVASMLDEQDNYFVPNNAVCDIKHKGSNFTWTWI